MSFAKIMVSRSRTAMKEALAFFKLNMNKTSSKSKMLNMTLSVSVSSLRKHSKSRRAFCSKSRSLGTNGSMLFKHTQWQSKTSTCDGQTSLSISPWTLTRPFKSLYTCRTKPARTHFHLMIFRGNASVFKLATNSNSGACRSSSKRAAKFSKFRLVLKRWFNFRFDWLMVKLSCRWLLTWFKFLNMTLYSKWKG